MRITLATARRVLQQVLNDRRTLVLILLVPSLLMGLVAWLFGETGVFGQVGPALLALFPFLVMFMVASITTLRERRSGTLERLLSMPMNKLDYILGYALALGLLAALQTIVATAFAVWISGPKIEWDLPLLGLAAVASAVLGATLGLFASAFAASEFQVMQFMPAFITPQILLGGVLMPRERMPQVLHVISDYLPLTHAVEAVDLAARGSVAADFWFHLLAVLGFTVMAVVLGAVTLRRRGG